MNLRFLFAMAVSKCVYYGMRLLGRQASYLPGWFAVKLCPDYLRHIRKAETVICVTGTDGKTTTANFLSGMLQSLPPLHDVAGMAGLDLPGYLGKVKSDKRDTAETGTGTEPAGQA